MNVAILQLCVDPRLNHELIRIQVGQQLARRYLRADRVVLVNEIGGNLSASFASALDLFRRQDAQIILCGVLHHDDCLAETHGLQRPIEETAARIQNLLKERHIECPVETGRIYTETNYVRWTSAASSETSSR